MPLIEISVPARLRHESVANDVAVRDVALLGKFDGLVVSDFSLAELLEDGGGASSALLDAGVTGGRARLESDAATRSLRCVMRLRSKRALDASEAGHLRDTVEGQLMDGFGSQPVTLASQPGAWVEIDAGPIAMRTAATPAADLARGWLARLLGRLPGRSPIFTALEQGRLDDVRHLARASRLHLDAKDQWDCTPLMLAIRDGHSALALELLALGASPTHRSRKNGSQALHFAAMAGDVAAGRALLMAGADVDAPKRDPDRHHAGSTALMWAVNRHHLPFVRMLVNAGAAVNRQSASGDTAAHGAALRPEHIALLEALLEAGADVSIRNQRGRTVVDEALALERNLKPEVRQLVARFHPTAFDARP